MTKLDFHHFQVRHNFVLQALKIDQNLSVAIVYASGAYYFQYKHSLIPPIYTTYTFLALKSCLPSSI